MKPGEAHCTHYCLQVMRLGYSVPTPADLPGLSLTPPEAPLLSGTELGGSDNLTVTISFLWPVPMSPQALCGSLQRSFPLNSSPLDPSFFAYMTDPCSSPPHPPPFHSKIGSRKLPLQLSLSQSCTKGNVICAGHLRGECELYFYIKTAK